MNIHRIFCIGRNYAEHIRELGNADQPPPAASTSYVHPETAGKSAAYPQPAPALPRKDTVAADDCVIFMKPASCIVPEGQPVRLPRGRGAVHHEAELVVMLTGGGADIAPEHALDSIAGITLGLDLTLRDMQSRLKGKGAPWELCKAFDGAAPLGDFKPYLEQDLQALEFTCHVNGQLRQHGHTRDMLYSVARQIAILSQTWALLPGDILYTGTPAGVGPLLPGDKIVTESPQIGRFAWDCA